MTITVKLFASFQTGRFAVERRDYAADTTVEDVVRDLAIPATEIGVLMVNGRHVELDRPLAPDEVLAIFPVIGGG